MHTQPPRPPFVSPRTILSLHTYRRAASAARPDSFSDDLSVCPRLRPVFARECGRGGQKTRGAPLRAPVDGSPSARQADLRSLPSDQVSKGSRDLEEITVSLRDIAIFTRISVQEQHRHLRRRER